mgnify:FL=1
MTIMPKKHGVKVNIVNSLSRSETKRNKRHSNKTIRQAGRRSSVLELRGGKSGK